MTRPLRIAVTTRAGQCVSVNGAAGQRLMELLRDEDLDVEAICGGMQSCGTCHVYLAAGWAGRLAPPGPQELHLLEACPGYRPGTSRLSCQIDLSEALDGLEVTVAPAA